jgi:hypothetical protein
MSSKKSLERARAYVDERNIWKINHNPIGKVVVLDYINHKGQLIPYETIITSNQRSELMVKSKAIRFNEDDLLSLDSESDDSGWVSDDDENEKKK